MRIRIGVTLVNQDTEHTLYKDKMTESIPRNGEWVHLPATYSSEVERVDWVWGHRMDVIITLKTIHLVCLDMVVEKFKDRMWYENPQD